MEETNTNYQQYLDTPHEGSCDCAAPHVDTNERITAVPLAGARGNKRKMCFHLLHLAILNKFSRGLVTELRDVRPVFDSRQWFISLCYCVQTGFGPTQPQVNRYWGPFSRG